MGGVPATRIFRSYCGARSVGVMELTSQVLYVHCPAFWLDSPVLEVKSVAGRKDA